MKHLATPSFWTAYARLPRPVRDLADRSFERLKSDPYHPSLRLKPVGGLWSVRVGLRYRALSVRDGETHVWFWIGSHADYEELIGRR